MIDWNRVQDLRHEVGDDAFEEVVDLFLEEMDEAISALPGTTGPALRDAFHFLKGSALNLGFCALADLSSAGETQLRSNPETAVDATKVVDIYYQSRADFLSRRQQANGTP